MKLFMKQADDKGWDIWVSCENGQRMRGWWMRCGKSRSCVGWAGAYRE